MDHLVRECREDDLPKLMELCAKHAEYEGAFFNSEGKLTALKNALFGNNPKLYCLIVENNETPVGYASYTFDFSTWDGAIFLHLDCLFIETEFRGFGLGEVLINKLKEIAIKRGCVNIQWQTPDFNVRAIKFYRRIGGVEKNKVRFFLSP
jgi:GNAT superfamily N-acetyltransferase